MQDVSSGKIYAAKEYLSRFGWGEVDKLMRFRHVSVHGKTCDRRWANFHALQERIIGFIRVPNEDVPMLVMEYHTGGDLAK